MISKVEDGAMVIDINLDDGLLDGMAAMQKFCKIAVTEPEVSKVREGTDSVCCVPVEATTSWSYCLKGLLMAAGRSIPRTSSISLRCPS